jgi:MFS transporter, putative metabolite:H+ symporter
MGTFFERRGLWGFVLGATGVTAGVFLHLPMFLMGRDMGYHLEGHAHGQ